MKKLEEAKQHHINGNLKQAEKIYKNLLIEDPKDINVLNLLSTLKIKQNQPTDALKTIDEALKFNDTEEVLHQTRGIILSQAGDLKEAKKSFKNALTNNPNLYVSQVALANIYFFEGNKKKAVQHYNFANKINSKQPDSHFGLAKIYMSEGDIDKAIKEINKIIITSENQQQTQRMLAILFLEKGLYENAEEFLEDNLKINPKDERSSLYLGLAKLQAGNFEEADELIYEFFQNNVNVSEAIAAVGLMKFKQNEYSLAIKYLENAIGNQMSQAPWSWKESLLEAKVKTGKLQQVIEFYQGLDYMSSKMCFRLAELYQQNGDESRARKQFAKIEEGDSYYLSSLQRISRSYLKQDNKEKAFNYYNIILKNIPNNTEAKLFEINYLLEKNDIKKACNLIESLKYNAYEDSFFYKTRLIYGQILDNENKFKEAMLVFKGLKKKDKNLESNKLKESEINSISKLESRFNDGKKEPIFVLGLKSTGISFFSKWLLKNNLNVFTDRLENNTRADILSKLIEIPLFENYEVNHERLERKKYFQKAKTINNKINSDVQIVDFMNINVYQVALIKKFFPKAKVVLLSRNTPDIWLNQKILKKELVDSSEWNETKNQLISMGLNLTQVDTDKWINNDQETLLTLRNIFETKLENVNLVKENFWERTYFPKDHWKNYQQFLGQ